MEEIKKKDCVIVGAGTYGEVYASYLADRYNIIGFIDDDLSKKHNEVSGLRILGDLNFLYENLPKNVSVFVPIGNNDVRVSILEKLEMEGFEIPSFIHPEACLHNSVILGKAVYVLPGSRVMPLSKIDNFTMISLGVNIAHHVHLENGCFLSQGTNIGASILLKSKAYVGIGATIMTGVDYLGANCLIGAGSVVIRNVEDNTVVIGNPAKFLKHTL